jgi:prepilin-type N-terminal cleavage/methylation domain-containing protein
MSRSRRDRSERGFTLLEVMMGLALLGFALAILIKDAGGAMMGARDAHMSGVVTDLSRAKMYDIEEKLLKEGFSDTEQGEEDQSFEDEGFPNITFSYKVEEVELPSYQDLMALAQGRAAAAGSASGSGSGSDGEGEFTKSFTDSALGGMLMGGMLGGGGSGAGIDEAAGGALIQGQYKLFQDILKVSIRKVTLTVKYQVMNRDSEMKTVMYLTDAGAMDKVLSGMGSVDADDQAGSGSTPAPAPTPSRNPRSPGSGGR